MTEPTKPETAPHKAAKTRSPNYPAINLGNAIEKARLLHSKEGKHWVPYSVAVGHWDYKPTSSTALQAVGALNQFGLIDIDNPAGSERKIKISDRALKIILDERDDSADRDQHIKDAAMAPAAHKLIWEKYGADLPSDPNLRSFLLLDIGFNSNIVDAFIAQYKATLSLAKFSKSDKIPQGLGAAKTDSANEAASSSHIPPIAPTLASGVAMTTPPITLVAPPAGIEEATFPIEGGHVVIRWPARLSQDGFQDLEDYLQLVLRRAKRSIAQQAPLKPEQ